MRRVAQTAILLLVSTPFAQPATSVQPPEVRHQAPTVERLQQRGELRQVEPVALDYAEAQEISDQVLVLQGAGDWQGSVALLRSSLTRCAAGEAGRSCRALLNYSLGFSLERQSVATGDELALQDATAAYNRVLVDRPGHPPTLRNLAAVHVRAGNPESAVRALQTVVFSADRITPLSTATSDDAVWLGELLAEQGNTTGALSAYRAAAAIDPRAGTPRRRIVGVYRTLEPASRSAVRLLEELTEWGADSPEEARRGYMWVIEVARAAQPPDPTTAKQALVSLVELLVDQDRLTRKSLSDLPRDWEPVADLVRYLESGSWGEGGFWLAEERSQELLARVALTLGRRWQAAARTREERAFAAQRTEACWSSATASAPEYDMGSGWMDLFTDLAALYTDRGAELDPRGWKFRELESQLFGGKGQAYRTNDREAIQRFHTILGLIYAHRGTWESDRPYRNATFQLRSAIDTAEEREMREGHSHQPLAKLKAMLADGYRGQGKHEKGYKTYLAAARAYLDVDDLESAAEMLEAGRGVSQPAWRQAEQEAGLTALVRLRHSVVEAADATCPQAQEGWEERRTSGLDTSFVSRQHFKVLADCSPAPGTVPAFSTRVARSALKVALEDEITLVGTADLLRLKKIESSLASSWTLTSDPIVKPGSYQVKSTVGDLQQQVQVDVQQSGTYKTLAFNWQVKKGPAV